MYRSGSERRARFVLRSSLAVDVFDFFCLVPLMIDDGQKPCSIPVRKKTDRTRIKKKKVLSSPKNAAYQFKYFI